MAPIGFIPKDLIPGSKIGWTIRLSMCHGMMQPRIVDGLEKGY
ncbi:hypothetical protein YDYSY3_60490 [Paenibacillus chitinolyticus]|nr:hypothetical protein YDYSY3_60490 [Paenibacillus chitinolyticus]